MKNRENSKLKNVKSKYKYVGSLVKAKSTPIPSIKTNDTKTLISDKDKAEQIAKFFESTFSPKTENLHHFPSRQIPLFIFVYFYFVYFYVCLYYVYFYYCLKTLNPKINASSDNLPSIFLKKCALNLTRPLCYMFNFSMMSGEIPQIWKESIVCHRINSFLQFLFHFLLVVFY